MAPEEKYTQGLLRKTPPFRTVSALLSALFSAAETARFQPAFRTDFPHRKPCSISVLAHFPHRFRTVSALVPQKAAFGCFRTSARPCKGVQVRKACHGEMCTTRGSVVRRYKKGRPHRCARGVRAMWARDLQEVDQQPLQLDGKRAEQTDERNF